MELDTKPNHVMTIEDNIPLNIPIDPSRARFPCCIVWTPLPVVSWLLPFVGHIGIAREDGVILDFAGPNFVCVDNFTFGAVARYIQINKDKWSMYRNEEEGQQTWDSVLKQSTQEYQHRAYNILTCNCHSFVAKNLNRLEFQGGGWNVVNVAALILLKGQWVDTMSMVRAYVPFVIIFVLGVTFGGASFLTFLAFFAFLLVGWYTLGTYCFKNIIKL
ncbi:protein RTE1-HOMOLOG-like [Rutidosis leptorrhynchoides]|uniref:protein RTE1-HOMOLOG-like n=1 Tax=Rutidosis leptorrhynchoides TaxID=125765 RepID=UPI003A99949F